MRLACPGLAQSNFQSETATNWLVAMVISVDNCVPGDMVTVAGVVKVVSSEEGWSSLSYLGLLQTDSIYRPCGIIGRPISAERFEMYILL